MRVGLVFFWARKIPCLPMAAKPWSRKRISKKSLGRKDNMDKERKIWEADKMKLRAERFSCLLLPIRVSGSPPHKLSPYHEETQTHQRERSMQLSQATLHVQLFGEPGSLCPESRAWAGPSSGGGVGAGRGRSRDSGLQPARPGGRTYNSVRAQGGGPGRV